MSDPAEPSSFDTTVDWGFLEHLVEHATHRLPALEGAAIKTGWAGLYEVSPDNQAIVGESELAGFWLCCGFSGHGFMQAPAVGRLLAAEITGAPQRDRPGAVQPRAFRPRRDRPGVGGDLSRAQALRRRAKLAATSERTPSTAQRIACL